MLMGSYVMKKYNIAKDKIEKSEAVTIDNTRFQIKHLKDSSSDFQRVAFIEDAQKGDEPLEIMIEAKSINISHRWWPKRIQ